MIWLQEDLERAQQAFEIVNRAFKTLENDDTRKKCLDIYQEAKERTEHMVSLIQLWNYNTRQSWLFKKIGLWTAQEYFYYEHLAELIAFW